MLELWESTWLLEFNVKKCKVLHTSFNNNPYNTYHLNGKVMLTSDQEKDLGVLNATYFGMIRSTLALTKQIR